MEISNYLSIGALIISGTSLFLSWRVSQRDRIRGEYNAKRDLFFAAKHYLDNLKKREYSSDEEERLEFELEKFFGKEALNKFRQAREEIEKTWGLSDDMNVLFQTLQETNPQEAERVTELFCVNPEFDPQGYKELQDYLDSWVIAFLEEVPERNRTRYSYREIEAELKEAKEKADCECNDFESVVKKKIKYS